RGDHPAGACKANFRSVHVRFEGNAHHLDELRTDVIVRLLKNAADGTESGHVTGELLLRHGARNIDRLDVDGGPAAILQDPTDAVAIPERELAGLVRLSGGEVWQERRGNALRRGHERIFRSAPPGDEPEPSALFCGAPQVRESLDRVVEEHYAEARDDR